jgi:ketosteroid isomerase-like protein
MIDSAADAVALVRGAFDTLARDGVEALIELVHEDAVVTVPAEFSAEPDSYRGPEGIRRYFASWYEVVDRLDIEIVDAEPVGRDTVVAGIELTVRGRATGLEAVQNAQMLCRLRGGKLDRMSFYETRDQALAAGLGAESQLGAVEDP